ncbi:PXA domain-containing protein [Lipomyces japonicus]|uniref:PXA domain-containing protein n=1 Tax=Lipomyces japonicus TaxID=56871 RepID=UPI0034CD1EC6
MPGNRLSLPIVVFAIAIAVALGLVFRANYIARVALQFFLLGVFVCSLIAFAAVSYFYKKTSLRSENLQKYRKVRFPTYAFAAYESWEVELALLADNHAPNLPLYPPSSAVSGSLDIIIDYVLRDFIYSWYFQLSGDVSFPIEVKNTIRNVAEQLRDRIINIDLVDFTMQKIVPILTKHVAEFATAETALRGKNLNKQLTESRELDIALAYKYANGELHPAASLKSPDPKMNVKKWIKGLVGQILPYVLPESDVQSRAVTILIQEIVACSVFLPLITALDDPDTWNQIIEKYASSALQDRKAVQRLRAALDKHATPALSKFQNPIVRLTAKSDERTYEKFIRGVRRCSALPEARRLRYDIALQLNRTLKDGNDDLFIRRLKNAKKLIDAKIVELNNENLTPAKRKEFASRGVANVSSVSDPREQYSFEQLLQSSAGLSYFMEFMDRHRRTVLLQFYMVVNGFKNPLEEEDSDDGDDFLANITVNASERWSLADREDIDQIYKTYFCEKILEIPESCRDTVKKFLDDPQSSTRDYRSARSAILKAQKIIHDILTEEDLPKFKTSDIFLKYLTSTDPEIESQASKGTVNDYHLLYDPNDIEINDSLNVDPDYITVDRRNSDIDDGLSISVQPEDDVVQAVQAAFADIMQSRPVTDDTSSNRSATSSSMREHLAHEDNIESSSEIADSPRSSLESSRVNILASSGSVTTTNMKSVSSLRSDLFGTIEDGENNIFPTNSALFEETSREIFSDDSFSSEDEVDALDKINVTEEVFPFIRRADPRDLGLIEEIDHLTEDIAKLVNQDAVLETLLKKAELTNSMSDLRILKKSKSSVEREIRRKELQRQQYIVQESDNGLHVSFTRIIHIYANYKKGRSKIHIQSAVTGSDNGKHYALYIIEVQRVGYEGHVATHWIVARRYSEFFKLHQHLRRRFDQVKDIDFPKKGVSMLKFQKSFIQSRKTGLESYLQKLLKIPQVCQDRAFRAFLSSQDINAYGSMEKNIVGSTVADSSKSTISLTNKLDDGDSQHGRSGEVFTRLYSSLSDGMDDLFNNFIVDYRSRVPLDQASEDRYTHEGQVNECEDTDSRHSQNSVLISENRERQEISEVEAELGSFEDNKSSSVPFIKPICDLFLELFDLNKGNNWLRGRASVVVLQQLLGGTIERKIREQIDNLAEEEMVIKLLHLVRERVWPDGSRNTKKPVRTAKDQIKTKDEAAFLINTLIQDSAAKVVGSTNARHASRRLFAMLQNKILNLHVTSLIIEEVVYELFPEIREN